MHSINERKIRFSEKYTFWGKKKSVFQEFSIFSESFGLTLLVPLAFWKLLIWTSCSKIISKFKSITYSVVQMENIFADP